MPSFESKLFYRLMRIFNIKKIINKTIEKGKRSNQSFFSRREKNKFNIFTMNIDRKEVSIMGGDQQRARHVIYFHGGMYMVEGNSAHKRWLIKLYNQANCRISYVDYPLAPEHTYLETIEMVVKAYQLLNDKYPEDDFILMGDSAGGGLVLVLAQYLRDHDIEHRPCKLILYSPWVRLDMTNPDVLAIAPRDAILDLDLLKKSARAYAGETNLSNRLLSPYYGSCENLGAIYVFYGVDEMLAPDIKLLEKKFNSAGAKAYFDCYQGMGHDFQLFTFLPESKGVLRKTVEIINQA